MVSECPEDLTWITAVMLTEDDATHEEVMDVLARMDPDKRKFYYGLALLALAPADEVDLPAERRSVVDAMSRRWRRYAGAKE